MFSGANPALPLGNAVKPRVTKAKSFGMLFASACSQPQTVRKLLQLLTIQQESVAEKHLGLNARAPRHAASGAPATQTRNSTPGSGQSKVATAKNRVMRTSRSTKSNLREPQSTKPQVASFGTSKEQAKRPRLGPLGAQNMHIKGILAENWRRHGRTSASHGQAACAEAGTFTEAAEAQGRGPSAANVRPPHTWGERPSTRCRCRGRDGVVVRPPYAWDGRKDCLYKDALALAVFAPPLYCTASLYSLYKYPAAHPCAVFGTHHTLEPRTGGLRNLNRPCWHFVRPARQNPWTKNELVRLYEKSLSN